MMSEMQNAGIIHHGYQHINQHEHPAASGVFSPCVDTSISIVRSTPLEVLTGVDVFLDLGAGQCHSDFFEQSLHVVSSLGGRLNGHDA